MIYNIINMNGYGFYVLSSFFFTLLSFTLLFLIIRSQLQKEQKKFQAKFVSLAPDKSLIARKQKINKEILDTGIFSKI